MEKKELEKKTVAELKGLAKKKKVSLESGIKKAEIIRLILKALNEEGEKVKKTAKPKPAKAVKPKVKKIAKKVKKEEKKIAKPATKVKRVAKKVAKAEVKPSPKVRPAVKEKKAVTPLLPHTPKKIDTFEEVVEEAKYYEPVEVHYPPEKELPMEYGENKIVIMARDPNWAFAYWEITPEILEKSRKKAGGGANLTLRVYDITGIDFDGKNALSHFDISVYERVSNWYIELGKPDRSFCADLGLLTPKGYFIPIVRSNVIITPRDKISEITDEKWMIMEEEFQKVFALSGGYGIGLSSPELQEIIKKRFAAEIFSKVK